jgi:hypothetical protein
MAPMMLVMDANAHILQREGISTLIIEAAVAKARVRSSAARSGSVSTWQVALPVSSMVCRRRPVPLLPSVTPETHRR